MKNLSRLTALLLALTLIFSSSVGSIAESNLSDLTRSSYDQMVLAAQEAAEAEAAAAAEEAAKQPIINEGGVVYEQDIPEQTKRFDIYEVITDAQLTMGGETDITLPQSGKINLTAGTDAQWQIYVPGADLWVNIAGETGSTFALTYAVIGGMLSGGEAKVRALAEDSAAVANITVAYGSALPAVEEEDTFVAETATASTFALRSSASDANAGIMTLEETGEDVTEEQDYYVIIYYIFEDGTVVADPYTAQLAVGSNFSATVKNPTVQGYLPYVDNATETAENVEVSVSNIQANVTYYVTYKPTNVNYTVIHYQQNVDNDGYTEVGRETKQGLTKSVVPEVAKTYDGFYSLIYERPEIAADGSTVVEVYYDRYYYLMNFQLGENGYGTEPVYARYGADLGTIKDPTRAGYTFKGWSLNGTDVVPTMPPTMPAENREYIAIWEADATAEVTVVFWGENADDEEYSYIKSAEINVKPGTSFTYSEDGSLICGVTETHTHSAECGYACNQTEHVHTIEDGCYELICTEKEHNHINDGCALSCTHTHNLSCYTTSDGTLSEISKPSESLTDRGNGIYTYTTWVIVTITHYVLNIGDKWYSSNGSWGDLNTISLSCNHSHDDSCYTCGETQTTHTHSVENGCYKLVCDETAHMHTDACGYKCGKTAHEHTSSCYMSGAGMDTNLWKFVKSDTVTVAADGSTVVNVYYDRVEKTLTFKYDYSYSYQKTETITAKWGEDISDEYVKIADNAGSTFWSGTSDGDGPYTNYFGIMPENSATYYNRGTTGDDGTMTYYGEDLNGTYSITLFSVGGVGGYTVTVEDRYDFEGFTYHHGTSTGSSCSGATFYYTRNSYNLIFNDGYNDVRTESVKYEAPLSTYKDYVPEVPSAYEPGAVTFGGWYLNPECTGAEYKLAEHIMPADNVLLYAKWVPVEHTVKFYLDQAAWVDGTQLTTHPYQTVEHGSFAETVADPTNGSYTFVGWFYMENGVEKAFDFENMPINKDLDVYGKWSSNVLKEYKVYYKIQGTDTEIAAPTTGSALAGVTKTFEAKTGTDLYTDYQTGYFPVTPSHSMIIDINATEENDTNVYTFEYVQKDAVPYIVKYVDKDTGEEVATQKVVTDNRKAVATEYFVRVSQMMPDAYQKRLVVNGSDVLEEGESWITVTVDGTEIKVHPDNVIIFYYVKDEEHAYYMISHYTENLEKDSNGNTTWTEYANSEVVGNIGSEYSADPMTINGFEYDSTVEGTVVKGTLTADGLHLKLYYIRKEYPYMVRYLEEGSGTQLATPKTGNAKYGAVIEENAIPITDYTALEPTNQNMTIRIETTDTAQLNIITFYYQENDVTINYEVVGPDGCGTVDVVTDSNDPARIASETIKIISGNAVGATAAASSNAYKFVGWYDKDGKLLSEDLNYVPVKVDGKNVAATYYAKFEWNLADLQITKAGLTQTTSEDHESAIFTVTDSEGNVVATVVIPGDESVVIGNLTVGEEYTITEDNGWAWRYSAQESTTVTINPPKADDPLQTFVTITNSQTNNSWLGGDNYKTNVFGK